MRIICTLTTILALHAAAANAQLIGWPGTGGNGFPFTLSGFSRYQQVYASSQFRASTITGIRFFRTVNPDGTGDIANARFTFSLSTTRAAVNGLNTANLGANVGADNTQVLNLLAQGVNIPFGQSFTLMFTNAFNFDPSLGNLLLDIAIAPNVGPGFILFDAHNGDFGALSSRAFNCCGSGFESYGLVTEFLNTPLQLVPEASTWSLTSGGLVLLGVALARMRRHRVPLPGPSGQQAV